MADTLGPVISLETVSTSVPKLNPNGSPLFALVDMGSNAIRYSISDLSAPSRLMRCVYKKRADISLYDALHSEGPGDEPGVFSSAVIANVASQLSHFNFIDSKFNVPQTQVSAYATEAVRTAKNKDVLLYQITQASSISVSILAPQVEALFGALGARSAFHHVDGLFLDLGGGSVQMSYLNSRVPGYEVRAAVEATSMPYGAAKLNAMISDPDAAAAAEADLTTLMATAYAKLKMRFDTLAAQAESPAGVSIYMCGGGFRGYGSMLMATHAVQPYPIPVIGGFTVAGDEFSNWDFMLARNGVAGKIFGLSKRRRTQFPAIALVVKALVTVVGKINKATFCAGSVREGVIFSMLPAAMQNADPVSFYPGADQVPSGLIGLLADAIPPQAPALFTPGLRAYLLGATWDGLGADDDANSARSLHEVICGEIAGLPGLQHDGMAAVATTMCARWDADLAPVDKTVFDSLRILVGEELQFWSVYLGTVLRYFAGLWPVMPNDGEASRSTVRLKAEWSTTLGKKKKKPGIKVTVDLKQYITPAVQELTDMLNDVEVGEYRVEATMVVDTAFILSNV